MAAQDDQDIELDSLTPMPHLRKVPQGAGAPWGGRSLTALPQPCPAEVRDQRALEWEGRRSVVVEAWKGTEFGIVRC